MRRTLLSAIFVCLAASSGFAQSRLNGKWRADLAPDPLTGEARRGQRVELEVSVADGKASGSFTVGGYGGGLGGRFYTFKDAKLNGDKVTFRIDVAADTYNMWTIDLVDDNTVAIGHEGPEPLLNNYYLPNLAAAVATTVQPAPAVQVVNSSLSGVVTDSSRAIIPGVTVKATNVNTGEVLTALTDGAGRYAFPSGVQGKYTLAASLAGFRTETVSDLNIGGTQVLQNITLYVGQVGTSTIQSATQSACSMPRAQFCAVLHRAE